MEKLELTCTYAEWKKNRNLGTVKRLSQDTARLLELQMKDFLPERLTEEERKEKEELDMSQLEYLCERYFDGLERPEDCEYIQHDTYNLRIFKDMFFEFIADKYVDDEFYTFLFDNVKVGKGNIESVERLVNELCPRKVRDVYYRLLCTKRDGKEFSQPYYARYTSQAISDGVCFKEKK